MSLVASLTGSNWGQPEEEKSFSFSSSFESVENQLLPLKAPSQSNLSCPFKQPSHTSLTFPNRLLTKQNSIRCSSFGSIAQPEELLGELSDWDVDGIGGGLSRTGTQRDLSVFSTALLSRASSKAVFSRQPSEIWNTDVKVDRESEQMPSQSFALNSPNPKDAPAVKQEHAETEQVAPVAAQVKPEPLELASPPEMQDDHCEIKPEDYASESSCASPTGTSRDGEKGPGKPPGGGRMRDMGIRRVKQQCYRDLKKSCEIQLTRLVPPSLKNRTKRDFNTLLRDVIDKVRSVTSGGSSGAGARRRGSVISEGAARGSQDEAARRHREALLSSETCGVARVDSENWTIVEANAQLARMLHVAPSSHDGVRRESEEIRASSGAKLLRGKTLFDIVHPHSTPHLVRACNALMHTAAEQKAPCKTRTVGMLSLQHDARLDCIPKLTTSNAGADDPAPVETCGLELIVCPAPASVASGEAPSRRCTLLLVARPHNPLLPGTRSR